MELLSIIYGYQGENLKLVSQNSIEPGQRVRVKILWHKTKPEYKTDKTKKVFISYIYIASCTIIFIPLIVLLRPMSRPILETGYRLTAAYNHVYTVQHRYVSPCHSPDDESTFEKWSYLYFTIYSEGNF